MEYPIPNFLCKEDALLNRVLHSLTARHCTTNITHASSLDPSIIIQEPSCIYFIRPVGRSASRSASQSASLQDPFHSSLNPISITHMRIETLNFQLEGLVQEASQRCSSGQFQFPFPKKNPFTHCPPNARPLPPQTTHNASPVQPNQSQSVRSLGRGTGERGRGRKIRLVPRVKCKREPCHSADQTLKEEVVQEKAEIKSDERKVRNHII